jgi:hypothetical protein
LRRGESLHLVFCFCPGGEDPGFATLPDNVVLLLGHDQIFVDDGNCRTLQ